MRSALLLSAAFSAAMLMAAPVRAQTVFSAADLMAPCQEADNDSRESGRAAQVQCEQYVMGFVGALKESGAGAQAGICTPEPNTAEEVCRSFIRWIYADDTKRKAMSADEALLGSLKDAFACN